MRRIVPLILVLLSVPACDAASAPSSRGDLSAGTPAVSPVPVTDAVPDAELRTVRLDILGMM